MDLPREKGLGLYRYAVSRIFKDKNRNQKSLMTSACLGSQVPPAKGIKELILDCRSFWFVPIYYVRYNLQRELIKASAFGTFKLRLDNILERIFKESALHWEKKN